LVPSGTDAPVVDNTALRRYELRVGDVVAGFVLYRLSDETITLIHTEVEPAYEGHGIGGRLVAGALDDIRSRWLHMIPLCPFVRSYIDRHPEYADLVAAPG